MTLGEYINLPFTYSLGTYHSLPTHLSHPSPPPTSHAHAHTPTSPHHTHTTSQDFIVDLDTFESHKAELTSQLESSLLPLTQFPQEDSDQLRKAAENLRRGYEIVAGKVCQLDFVTEGIKYQLQEIILTRQPNTHRYRIAFWYTPKWPLHFETISTTALQLWHNCPL